jgi:hypothetical protein
VIRERKGSRKKEKSSLQEEGRGVTVAAGHHRGAPNGRGVGTTGEGGTAVLAGKGVGRGPEAGRGIIGDHKTETLMMAATTAILIGVDIGMAEVEVEAPTMVAAGRGGASTIRVVGGT